MNSYRSRYRTFHWRVEALCVVALLRLFVAPVSGAGYALEFRNDGMTHAVGIAFVPELNLYPFTVTAWINANAQVPGGFQATPIISKPNTDFDGWALSIFEGHIRAIYVSMAGPGSITGGGLPGNGGLDGGYVADGQWHHVAFTVDNTGGKLYVDGVVRATGAWTGTPGPTTLATPLFFGSNSGAPLSQYVGLLDEVSLWNTALSQAQIQIYKTRDLTGAEPSLVAYYRCDEESGGFSHDSAPAGGWNDGLWNNMYAIASNAPIAFLPRVRTLPALTAGPTTATLRSLLNPLGTNTSAWFEWGPSTNYGNLTPALPVGDGTNEIDFAQTIASLASLAIYHFRAVASNHAGVAFSTNSMLMTAASLPPAVQTLMASSVFGESATLHGSVVPRGAATWAWFEWGSTTNYGNATLPQAVGEGGNLVSYTQHINTIPFGSDCHFRAVASNQVGVARGSNVLAVPQLFTGGTDINLITGPEFPPHLTQNEAAIWSHGDTIVVAYNDSRYLDIGSFCGVSVSTNRGATFTRLAYTFNQPRPGRGRPALFYSVRAGKWCVFFVSDACGPRGIGRWESTDGLNWAFVGCVPPGLGASETDGASAWVDNNPGSPFFGRQYVAFNDFSQPGPVGPVRVCYSSNDGTNWSIGGVPSGPHTRRSGRITGSRGTDGAVFLPILDESGGGTNLNRVHFLAGSTNGGLGWTLVQVVAPVLSPGRSTSGYWSGIYDAPTPGYWREMGWGQAGVGPDRVVHYAYSAGTTDVPYHPNIYYVRSTDNGLTWSQPIQLNTDDTPQRQWNPSVAVNANGIVFVSWYDERKSPGDLEYYGRVSLDNGANWAIDAPISDAPFRRPNQFDPAFSSAFFGFYIDSAFSDDGYGDIGYRAWVDGRVVLNNTYVQQDVFFDQVRFGAELRIVSITRAPSGDIILLGTGRPNRDHSLQSSTTLASGSFTNLGSVIPNRFGMWKHNLGPAAPGSRFFRLSVQ